MSIEQIKQEIDLLDYITTTTGNKSKKVGSNTYRIIPCPICGSGENHFNVNTEDNYYKSFKDCCNGGSIIDFLIEYEGLDKVEAIKKAEDLAGYSNKKTLKSKKKKVTNVTPKKDYTKMIEEMHKNIFRTDYFNNRGLTEETITKYKLGYSPEGTFYGQAFKYLLPVAKDHVIFRSDNQKDRYRNTKGTIHVLNERYLTKPKLTNKYIFITEGYIDALSFEEIGYNAIATNSTSNADKVIETIKANKIKLQDKILIIASDNDKAGEKFKDKFFNGLEGLNLVIEDLKLPKEYNDVNDYLKSNREEFKAFIKDFVSSIGKKDFVSSYINQFLKDINDFKNQKILKTGFAHLDYKLGGGLLSGLYVIGAISSLGKTTLIQQISDYIALKGTDVLNFSLEMSKFEMVSKSLSREMFKVNSLKAASARNIMLGKFDHDIMAEALENYEPIAKNTAYIEGNFGTGVHEIRQRIEKHINLTGRKPLVIIDYLQIIKPLDLKMSDKQANDYNVSELKRITRDFNIPMIVISSLNRSNYSVPIGFESFKETGAIEYGADNVLGLQLAGIYEVSKLKTETEKRKRINELKSSVPRQVEIVILKQRNGMAFATHMYDYYAQFNYFVEKDNK